MFTVYAIASDLEKCFLFEKTVDGTYQVTCKHIIDNTYDISPKYRSQKDFKQQK